MSSPGRAKEPKKGAGSIHCTAPGRSAASGLCLAQKHAARRLPGKSSGGRMCFSAVSGSPKRPQILFFWEGDTAASSAFGKQKTYYQNKQFLKEVSGVLLTSAAVLQRRCLLVYGTIGVSNTSETTSPEGTWQNSAETGLHYLNSRYYNPTTGRFISADDVITDAGETQGYNLFAYGGNNPVNTIDTAGNWPSWATKLVVGTAVIAAVATVRIAAGGAAAGSLLAAVHCVAAGVLQGAVIGAVTGAITGAAASVITNRITTGSWKGTAEAAIEGAASGYVSGAISGAVTGGVTSSVCFVAGTAILTAIGTVAIEEISAGDRLHSFRRQRD